MKDGDVVRLEVKVGGGREDCFEVYYYGDVGGPGMVGRIANSSRAGWR